MAQEKAHRPMKRTPCVRGCSRCWASPRAAERAAEKTILRLLRQIDARLAKLEARVDTDRLAVPIEDAQRLLGCGRTQIYMLLRQGRLQRTPKIGRKVMVTMDSITRLLEGGRQLTTGEAKGMPRSRHPAGRGAIGKAIAAEMAKLRI